MQLHPRTRTVAAAVGLISALAATLAPSSASADLTIDVGDIDLLADTAGQQVTIDVLGGDSVAGVNFIALVADGGPELVGLIPDIAGIDAPSITDVDLLTGTIFEGSATQFELGPPFPQLVQEAATVDSGGVEASGTLVTLTFDTTGFAAGTSFDLSLEVAALAASTEFPDPNSTTGELVPLTITNGRLNLVPIPEPTSLALLGLVGMSLTRRRI